MVVFDVLYLVPPSFRTLTFSYPGLRQFVLKELEDKFPTADRRVSLNMTAPGLFCKYWRGGGGGGGGGGVEMFAAKP
jgi:hypothetical protein